MFLIHNFELLTKSWFVCAIGRIWKSSTAWIYVLAKNTGKQHVMQLLNKIAVSEQVFCWQQQKGERGEANRMHLTIFGRRDRGLKKKYAYTKWKQTQCHLNWMKMKPAVQPVHPLIQLHILQGHQT